MTPRIEMKDLRECKVFFKNPDSEAPKILQALEVHDIRLLLQATAESIITSDNSQGMKALKRMFTLINNRYPLNKHEESPERCDETYGKKPPRERQ